MIIFCVDQIAGAEYIGPLLRRWRQQGRSDWLVCSGSRSVAVLQAAGFPCTVIDDGNVEDEVERIISTHQPSIVLMSSSTGSRVEAVFRRALRDAGILCVQFIDMWVNYAVRFRDEFGQADLPDQILTLDELARQAMIEEGMPAERIVVIGQPYFEERLQAIANTNKLAQFNERALMVTQPVFRHLGRHLGYDETDFFEGALQAWYKAGLDWHQLDLIVHPDEDRQTYRKLLDRHSRSIRIIENSDLDWSNYSLVIGMYSSLMIHAMLYQVNVVSFQPGAIGTDACHLSSQGLIKRLTTLEQLANFLVEFGATAASGSSTLPVQFLSAIQGSCDRLEKFLSTK